MVAQDAIFTREACEHEVRESSFHQGWTPDERATSIIMMEPPVTSKVLRAPSLKRGQENVRIQDRVCANVGVAHCVCAVVRSYAVPCARVALVARIPGSVASRGLVILCGKFTVRFHATFPLGQPLFLLVDRITLLAHVAFVTSVLSVTSNDFFFSRLQVLSQSTTNFFLGRKWWMKRKIYCQ